MKRCFAILGLLTVLMSAAFAAEDESGFTIRFYDKKVYFLGDQIQVEAAITNGTAETMRFNIADNRFFSIDFDVRTTTNQALGHARQFITERNSDQPVFFRDITLAPGETYSIVVDIASYAQIGDAGLYVVQGQFFPALWRGKDSQVLKSNRLTLNVRPPVVTAEARAAVEAETGALIAREPMAPDLVVAYTIQARQRSQWDKFFLYLDLPSLLRKNPDKDRVWRKSNEQAQQAMLEQFKQQLMAAKVGQDINVIPSSFQIQKTSYSPSEGTVQVLEKFTYADFTELKQYLYHLKKTDRYWIIDDYEIKNLGTE